MSASKKVKARRGLHLPIAASEGTNPEGAKEVTRGRKRKRDETSWTQKKRKGRRNRGLSYTPNKKRVRSNSTDHIPRVASRIIKDPCANCRRNCSKRFTEEQRQDTFSSYWQLGKLPDQQQFILNNISVEGKKRTRKRANIGGRKEHKTSHIYTLCKTNICKTMFLNTLGISKKVMRNAIEKGSNNTGIVEKGSNNTGIVEKGSNNTGIVEKDRRGSTKNRKFDLDVTNSLKGHIKSFPVVESHYLRKQTKRNFLSSNLSVSKMYDLYLERYKDANFTLPSYTFYITIFNEKFNIGFHKPK